MGKEDKKKIIFISTAALMILAIVLVVGVLGKGGKQSGNTVVCSFYPVYVLTENLLEGTNVNVVNMTENLTGCIHDYQMTTKDMKALEGAKVLVVNGGGMESFLSNIKKNYPELAVIETAATHSEEENPHLWMSTDFEMDCIDYVSEALCEQFPNKKEKIRKNAQKYADEVFEGPYGKRLELSDRIEESGLDIDCICFNEAFEVFTEALGLHNIAVFSLDENEMPSANEIAEAIEKAKKSENVAVLIEKDLAFHADKIVNETGAKVIFIDPLTTGEGTDSYIKGMTENLKAVEEYLDNINK
ncbi:MAG: metal ABC transporter substrate-binding protein [Lachnospiraceae bacterium]|nr:metal ABC transporter substrate-binding protein [Lachnospiraceae bacterium]